MVQSLIFVTVTMLHYVFPKHPQKQRNIVTDTILTDHTPI